jgi:hypothetical protein
VIVGHIMGIPVEETLLQYGPVWTVAIMTVTLGGRATLSRLRGRLHRRR